MDDFITSVQIENSVIYTIFGWIRVIFEFGWAKIATIHPVQYFVTAKESMVWRKKVSDTC